MKGNEGIYSQKDTLERFKLNTRRANSTLYGGNYNYNANNRGSFNESEVIRPDSSRYTHKLVDLGMQIDDRNINIKNSYS